MFINAPSWGITRNTFMSQNVITYGTLSEEIRQLEVRFGIGVLLQYSKTFRNSI
jgi:hypothetical protein